MDGRNTLDERRKEYTHYSQHAWKMFIGMFLESFEPSLAPFTSERDIVDRLSSFHVVPRDVSVEADRAEMEEMEAESLLLGEKYDLLLKRCASVERTCANDCARHERLLLRLAARVAAEEQAAMLQLEKEKQMKAQQAQLKAQQTQYNQMRQRQIQAQLAAARLMPPR